MSATVELLLEDIRNLETQLQSPNISNDPYARSVIDAALKEARQKLQKASEALNENRSVLKG